MKYCLQAAACKQTTLIFTYALPVTRGEAKISGLGSLITIIANTLPCFRVDVAQFRLVQGVPTNNPLFVCSSIIHLYLPTT